MSIIEKTKEQKKEIIQPKKMGLLVENPVYKPFRYPWCYDAWLTQQRIHWLPEEVPLGDDVMYYPAEAYHQQYLEKGGQSAKKSDGSTIRCYG